MLCLSFKKVSRFEGTEELKAGIFDGPLDFEINERQRFNTFND